MNKMISKTLYIHYYVLFHSQELACFEVNQLIVLHSNKLSKFTSVSQTSTVLGRLAGDYLLHSKLDLRHIFLPLLTMVGKDEL